jgi:hypothetical protein
MWERVERLIVGLMVAIAVSELTWVSYVFSVLNARS